MRTEKNIVTKANKRRKLDDNDVDWDVSQNHISDESVIQLSSTEDDIVVDIGSSRRNLKVAAKPGKAPRNLPTSPTSNPPNPLLTWRPHSSSYHSIPSDLLEGGSAQLALLSWFESVRCVPLRC